MPIEYTTSAISTEVMWNLLQQRGISESEIAENTSIDPSVLHFPNKRILLGQYLRLWELAISLTGDPALGLHLSRYYNSGQFHFVTSIVFSSATLLDGLQQWIRYVSLVCNADRFELQEHGDFVTLVYTNISQTHENRWLPELYFSLMDGLGANRVVMVFGATGPVGDGLLKAAIEDPEVEKIYVITRRTSPRIEAGVDSGKVEMRLHQDFTDSTPSPWHLNHG